MTIDSHFHILDLADDAAILSVLERERAWAVYPLSDLEPPHRQFGRYIGAARDGTVTAVLLVYAPPDFTSLIPSGESDGVRAVFANAERLPASCLFHVRSPDMPAFLLRYEPEDRQWFLRLTVEARTFADPPPVDARLVHLSPADLPEVQALYTLWGETLFTPLMLEWGVYVGAYQGGDLLAVAGTHVVSRAHKVASIGGVFTHPGHRGRGLAAATTGAVARELFARGIDVVALNVRADNAPAIRAYQRIGMTVALGFWEGLASLRQGTIA